MEAVTRGAHCAGVGCAHAHPAADTAATPSPAIGARAATRGRRATRRRDRVPADLAALGSGRRVLVAASAVAD